MPSPERGEPTEPDQPTSPESEPVLYQRAARFAGERPAGRAYTDAQRRLYLSPESELSVYRLQLNRQWYVAAIGLLPPRPLRRAIESILARGEPATLPTEIWQALAERHDQAARLGPWVEGHHRERQ